MTPNCFISTHEKNLEVAVGQWMDTRTYILMCFDHTNMNDLYTNKHMGSNIFKKDHFLTKYYTIHFSLNLSISVHHNKHYIHTYGYNVHDSINRKRIALVWL